MLNYLKYSGCNITLKLNPFHWRLAFTNDKCQEVWQQDSLILELLPITIRLWVDDGKW